MTILFQLSICVLDLKVKCISYCGLRQKIFESQNSAPRFPNPRKGCKRYSESPGEMHKIHIPQAWLKPNSSDCLGLEPQSFWCSDSDVVSSQARRWGRQSPADEGTWSPEGLSKVPKTTWQVSGTALPGCLSPTETHQAGSGLLYIYTLWDLQNLDVKYF